MGRMKTSVISPVPGRSGARRGQNTPSNSMASKGDQMLVWSRFHSSNLVHRLTGWVTSNLHSKLQYACKGIWIQVLYNIHYKHTSIHTHTQQVRFDSGSPTITTTHSMVVRGLWSSVTLVSQKCLLVLGLPVAPALGQVTLHWCRDQDKELVVMLGDRRYSQPRAVTPSLFN